MFPVAGTAGRAVIHQKEVKQVHAAALAKSRSLLNRLSK